MESCTVQVYEADSPLLSKDSLKTDNSKLE